MDTTASRASERTRKEYARRLDLSLEFIDAHLGDDIPLARLAEAACFSPYHFHRLFTAMVGEPPAEYVRRLRLEKAAVRLVNEPAAPVTDIALACGFSTPSLFSRLFRARFGSSPTEWRQSGGGKRKNGQQVRKDGKDGRRRPDYRVPDRRESPERRSGPMRMPKVRIEDVPPLRVAYVKHMKGYEDSAGIGEASRPCSAGPARAASWGPRPGSWACRSTAPRSRPRTSAATAPASSSTTGPSPTAASAS